MQIYNNSNYTNTIYANISIHTITRNTNNNTIHQPQKLRYTQATYIYINYNMLYLYFKVHYYRPRRSYVTKVP